MSRSGRQEDGGPIEPPEEGDLVALLYGELEGEEERALRARVASEPSLAGRFADLARVREAVGSLPDEEPPARLSALLMAQAAQAAQSRRVQKPASEESAGLWATIRGWLQPLIAHPGLAAAASVIVVAGIAGLLVARKGDVLLSKADSTSGSDRAAAQAAAPALRQEVPVTGAAPARVEGGVVNEYESAEESADSSGAGAGVEGTAEPVGKPGLAVAERDRPVRRAKKSTRGLDRLDLTDPAAGKDEPVAVPATDLALGLAEGQADESAARRADKAKAGDGASERNRPAEGVVSGKSPPAAPPPPAASSPAEPSPPAQAPPASGDSADRQGLPASKAETPAELYKRALDAAVNRRCADVQALAQSIRRLDPSYHARVVQPDKRLASCLAAKPAK